MSYCEQCTQKQITPPAAVNIVNPCDPVLFHRVDFPASIGDDTTNPPETLNYKNVLLFYEANNHAYLYSSDGVPTFISMGTLDVEKIMEILNQHGIEIENLTTQVTTNTEDLAGLTTVVEGIDESVNKLEGDVSNLTEELQLEKDTRTEQVASIQSAINEVATTVSALEANLNQEVEQSTAFNANDSTVDVVHTKVNLKTNTTLETMDALPVASQTTSGVMNAATYTAVQENSELINSILNGAVAIDGLPAIPTQEELTTRWKAASGESELINRASIFDIANQKVWYYYGNVASWQATSSDGSTVTVSQATNSSLGIVKGSLLDGQSFVEADGTLSVNKWDETQERITNLESQMEQESIRTKNLPPQVVYKTSLPEYKADEVDLTLIVKDLHTGGDASLPLNIMGATSAKAGVMTSTQANDLQEIVEQFPTTMQDVDDALGDIATIQADYVSKTDIMTTEEFNAAWEAA